MSPEIPEGYMANAQGHLVPVDQIKEIDLARHELVMEKVAKAKALQKQLAEFKAEIMGDIEAFVAMSAEEYGVKIGGEKGNITLASFNGQYQIKRAISERLTFSEQLQAAKALIDECLKTWTASSPTELRALVNDAFQVDKAGRINTGRILGLRRLDIKDDRWGRAMEAISNSIQVGGIKAYFNIYERDASGNKRAISLDLASL